MQSTLHEDQYTFFIISRSVLLLKRNISGKICRDNQSTHFVFSNFFFFENRAVYETMWKDAVERGRPQMTKWRMRIACWILCAVLYCLLWFVWLHHILPHLINGTIFGKKKKLIIKCVYRFSQYVLFESLFILRRNERDIINVHRSSCREPVILVRL